MKLLVDTADPKEVSSCLDLIDGVTTNPSLAAAMGRRYPDLVREICELVGPGRDVSAEVLATDYDSMVKEALAWTRVAKNVVVKIPIIGKPAIEDGIKAVRFCAENGIRTNVTICANPWQAFHAAKAGATFISPFVGRLEDVEEGKGLKVVRDIVRIYRNYPDLKTQVLFASVRSLEHLRQAMMIGAHVVTSPVKFIHEMRDTLDDDLSRVWLDRFIADAEKIPK